MNRTVLLVEDNEDLRSIAHELLSDEGFQVQLAGTGREVLAILRSGFRPGCVLLDLGLPDMSAADFLEAYTQIPGTAQLPIAIVSGNAELGDWARRFKTGRIIKKPYGVDALVEAAADLCGAALVGSESR